MVKSLSMPDDNQTMDCGLRKEIISALTTLVKTFPKRMEPYINDTLSQIWSCLVHNSSIYTCLYANCLKVDQKEMYDSEGEELKFDNLIHQLFEFILCLKDKKRYKPIIKTAIDELCYYSITYMQITEEQVDTWTTSPEQFVEEEDEDSFSCTLRVSGQELLDVSMAQNGEREGEMLGYGAINPMTSCFIGIFARILELNLVKDLLT
jgi:hypothetical protein